MPATVELALRLKLSERAEARLIEEAQRAGRDVAAYASELIERAVGKPSLDEILAPFQKQVADSGMSDEELDQFYEGLRDDAWRERHPKP